MFWASGAEYGVSARPKHFLSEIKANFCHRFHGLHRLIRQIREICGEESAFYLRRKRQRPAAASASSSTAGATPFAPKSVMTTEAVPAAVALTGPWNALAP